MPENTRAAAITNLKDLILRKTTPQDGLGRPKNITVWCGAGFSKSWNQASPTDGTLFQIDKSEFLQLPNLCHVLNALGWKDNDKIGFEGFKTLNYLIDMMKKYPDIRNQYIDIHTLDLAIQEMRHFIENNFFDLCGTQDFDPKELRFHITDEQRTEQQHVLDFFERLLTSGDNDDTRSINFITTNYDHAIESILDNMPSRTESILPSLYRGVTPSSIGDAQSRETINDSYKHTLIKLNGGFEILRTDSSYRFQYHTRDKDRRRERPPIIMLPNREQDYSDPYFAEIFPKAVRLLRETDILIVIGYSMPWEDVLIRFILHQFAESEVDAVGKHLVCVDLKGPEILESRLRWTFSAIEKTGWPRVQFYPGAFIDFCEDFVSD